MLNLRLAQIDSLGNDNAKSPLHPELADFGGRYEYQVGSAFSQEKTRNPKALGDAIRALLKSEQEAKRLPGKAQGVKYGVTVKWSGHQLSARVEVKGLTNVINPAFIAHGLTSHMHDPRITRFVPEVASVVERISRALGTLNYNRSDSMTDYSDVGFFQHVEIDGAHEEHERLYKAARA